MYPHRIRLRGPWEWEMGTTPAGRVVLPLDPSTRPWGDAASPLRLRRRFGRPRQFDAGEYVWLTIAAAPGVLGITLNDKVLSISAPLSGAGEFEVTNQLQERNELVLEVIPPAASAKLWGDIALEIRRSAYLRHIRVQTAANGAQIRGEVVGGSDQPLELYAVQGRHTVAYASLAGVGPFELKCDTSHSQVAEPLRIELIAGAVVWYAVELDICQPAAASERDPNS